MTIAELTATTLRTLSIDMIQKANSGHPGLPLGVATIAATLWQNHLRFSPEDPEWANRDRFVLSAGHGSALLYSLLHVYGYPVNKNDLESFRQWESVTPGHPEYGHTVGVEVTTGPLGQGFATGVGLALGERFLGSKLNTEQKKLIDYTIYAIVSDGDLMEGLATEAASLAGHLQLRKLVYLYDDNNVCIDGKTNLSFSEDTTKKFEALGWFVQSVDGNDSSAIDQAISTAKNQDKPSLIRCATTIGFGSPNKQGTSGVHGSPLGVEELALTKKNLGWTYDEPFFVPQEVYDFCKTKAEAGNQEAKTWRATLQKLSTEAPEKFALWTKLSTPPSAEASLQALAQSFASDDKAVATRVASGKALQVIAQSVPGLIGGSADLAPSNNTFLKDLPTVSATNPAGQNIHFGIREHAMGATLNGLALSASGVVPYGGTFLVFSDYMRGSIRLAALMGLGVTYVFTHDSIGLGEDGPTHQPIEHLASLRAMPNLCVLRPADACETAYAWEIALRNRTKPTILALSRQNLPILTKAKASATEKGAYILIENSPNPDIILIATGSEVMLAHEAYTTLSNDGVHVRVVSMPSWDLFAQQSDDYKESVLPHTCTNRISIEAGATFGWERFVGLKGIAIGIDHFGASAPAEQLYKHFGITTDHIIEEARKLLG